MITEIKSVEINETEVILEGINLETIFTSENLYEELEEENVRFVFDRHEHGGSNLKYLWKVCASQKNARMLRAWGRNWKAGRLYHLSFRKFHRTLTKKQRKAPERGLFFCAGIDCACGADRGASRPGKRRKLRNKKKKVYGKPHWIL